MTTLTITNDDGSQTVIRLNDQEVANMVSCWRLPNRYLGPTGALLYAELVDRLSDRLAVAS